MKRGRGKPQKSALANQGAQENEASADRIPERRQSRRLSSTPNKQKAQSTPTKSRYFDHDSSEPVSDSEAASESDFGNDSPASSSASEQGDSDDGYESTESSAPKRRKNAANFTPVRVSGKKAKELWRAGAKVDLEPGQEVFIKLPKAREVGKTPYKDHTIHPNTLLFLGDLKRHNDREWLKFHDADFRTSQKDFSTFIEQLSEKLAEKDDTLPELPPKDIVFRIYRDIRFSKDPTPYKTHFSAAWSRTGRKGPYAAYYLQIAPGNNFLGGGLWCPEASSLNMLRRNVDKRSNMIKEVLLNDGIRKTFLNGVSNDEGKAVKAFAKQNAGNALKRKPKGYEDDNPNIELLRLKNFTIGRKLTDDEVLGSGSLESIADMLGTLAPFVAYLNGVVMPDDPGENDSGDSSSEDD